MKIAWFTPLSQKSAIGRFSQGVTAELAKRASVDIFCFDEGPTHQTNVPVRKFMSANSISAQTLAPYDVIFYNFGNHIPFHLEIFKTSRRFPGVAVIHDFVMHHFFVGYYMEVYRSPDAYLKALEGHYGKTIRDTAAAAIKRTGPPYFWDSEAVVDCPLFEETLVGALGVIAHSDFLKEKAARVFGGPIRKIPLHYKIDRAAPTPSRQQLGIKPDSLLIITIGQGNPNKRITSTIDALGQIRDSVGPLEFIIAGACAGSYRKEIDAAIRRNKLENVVKVAGEVTDEVLRGYLAAADICVNLRYPAMEGASASAIEEMLFGKPVIVANVGFYAELPSGCVVKVEPNSPAELRAALKDLATGKPRRERLGQAALAFAQKEFGADRYADMVVQFAGEVRRARPLIGLVDKLARECRQMGLAGNSATVENLSAELAHLFGPRR